MYFQSSGDSSVQSLILQNFPIPDFVEEVFYHKTETFQIFKGFSLSDLTYNATKRNCGFSSCRRDRGFGSTRRIDGNARASQIAAPSFKEPSEYREIPAAGRIDVQAKQSHAHKGGRLQRRKIREFLDWVRSL